MNPEALALFSAVADGHRQLRAHAIRLRERDDVREVTHQCDMPLVEGAVRIVEFVDAELACGDAISWCLETTVTPDEVLVEADVRRIHGAGQDVLFHIAENAYPAGEAARALPEVAQRLCSATPF